MYFDEEEEYLKPVGQEFIEEERHPKGRKLLKYYCKLCDCKFTGGVNAKSIHLKGRRHRELYRVFI